MSNERTSISVRGKGQTLDVARNNAAEQVRSILGPARGNERVYLDNNEPRVEAWRPVMCSVQPTLMAQTGASMYVEAEMMFEWMLGES